MHFRVTQKGTARVASVRVSRAEVARLRNVGLDSDENLEHLAREHAVRRWFGPRARWTPRGSHDARGVIQIVTLSVARPAPLLVPLELSRETIAVAELHVAQGWT